MTETQAQRYCRRRRRLGSRRLARRRLKHGLYLARANHTRRCPLPRLLLARPPTGALLLHTTPIHQRPLIATRTPCSSPALQRQPLVPPRLGASHTCTALAAPVAHDHAPPQQSPGRGGSKISPDFSLPLLSSQTHLASSGPRQRPLVLRRSGPPRSRRCAALPPARPCQWPSGDCDCDPNPGMAGEGGGVEALGLFPPLFQLA